MLNIKVTISLIYLQSFFPVVSNVGHRNDLVTILPPPPPTTRLQYRLELVWFIKSSITLYWLLLGSPMLVDPHPSQRDAGLHLAACQLQEEVTRSKARCKPTLPKKSGVDGGSKSGANISWQVASPVLPTVIQCSYYHHQSFHYWGLPYDTASCPAIQRLGLA